MLNNSKLEQIIASYYPAFANLSVFYLDGIQANRIFFGGMGTKTKTNIVNFGSNSFKEDFLMVVGKQEIPHCRNSSTI